MRDLIPLQSGFASSFLADEDANKRLDPWAHSHHRFIKIRYRWREWTQGSGLSFASSCARNADASEI